MHSTTDYVEFMKEIFDFDLIRSFLSSHPDFKVLFDALSGVTGPYGIDIFEITSTNIHFISLQSTD